MVANGAQVSSRIKNKIFIGGLLLEGLFEFVDCVGELFFVPGLGGVLVDRVETFVDEDGETVAAELLDGVGDLLIFWEDGDGDRLPEEFVFELGRHEVSNGRIGFDQFVERFHVGVLFNHDGLLLLRDCW